MWGHRKKVAILPETKPSNTLILALALEPLQLWENELLLCKPSSLWYLVISALAYLKKKKSHTKKAEIPVIHSHPQDSNPSKVEPR